MNTRRLDTACTVGDIPVMDSVLQQDPHSINRKDEKLGWTPLFRSVVSGHIKAVQFLLSRGADANISTDHQEFPLHQAVEQGQYEMAKSLLKHRADPNAQDEEGTGALHIAVQKSDIHMIELLLKYKANANMLSKQKRPLHIAVEKGDEVSIRVLINHGASPYEVNASNQSPLDIAENSFIKNILKENRSENYSDTSLELTTLELPDRVHDLDISGSNSRNKISLAEIQQGKFFYWLEKNSLQDYYDIFVKNGYSTLEELLIKTKGPVPLSTQELEYIGIHKPGHRYKILIKLDEEAAIDRNLKYLALYRNKNTCFGCKQDPFLDEIELDAWLEAGQIGQIRGVLAEAGYDLELVLMQAQSAYTFSHTMLKNEINVLDKTARERFLMHVRQTLNNRHVMPFTLYYNRGGPCDQCILV